MDGSRLENEKRKPALLIAGETEWWVAFLLTRRPAAPFPARSGSPGCLAYGSRYAPSGRGAAPQSPLPEGCVSVCVYVDLGGVSASINTAPAEGDTGGKQFNG